MRRPLIILCAAMLAATLPCGCSRKESLPDGPALKAYAEKARDEARTASEAKDPKAARLAADRAKAAKEKAEKQEAGAAEADRAAAQELAMQVTAVARAAARFTELAEEEQSLSEKTGSLKLKAYRAARGPALKVVFAGLALAAERAGPGYDLLGQRDKALADLAEMLADDLKRPNGKPDWRAIAARMKAYGDNPPPRVGMLLAVAYTLAAFDDLALAEADLLKPEQFTDPQEKLGCRFVRGFVLQARGMPRLASRELDAVTGPEAAKEGLSGKPEFMAGVHLLLAYMAAQERDYRRADIEIMRATRIWPNNPVGVLLTGEVMVAEGRYEKAAGTMEDGLREAGVDVDPALVQLIQKRAREIRDKKGEAQPLFTDKRFLSELAIRYIWQAARSSKPAKRLEEFVDSARSFGGEVVKALPAL
ncbi:MAG: hypothetical protein NT049_13685 [Planctomycetota bacterium]|nr:hypothetical protein [Planctomycetota bacterium]